MPTTPPPRPQSQPQPLRNRGLWQSYAALSPQTRLRLSLGVCAVALIGIFVSDMLERRLPPRDTAIKQQQAERVERD
ncbi:hypothetical protein BDM02DRAFT_3112235 [Thelephora ganbajun]|uniref:Uncharacterized protein n=1 Tax=Thelephora ganbajun TaxID=370292 RepID=A0ACB6ZLD5_THEGA|nr:hypothetical protein BDM02DRAFT_3112235 [Thelephora ganbajun]